MKLTVHQLAQFDADAKLVRDYIAHVRCEPMDTHASEAIAADNAAERIHKLARELMTAEIKVS